MMYKKLMEISKLIEQGETKKAKEKLFAIKRDEIDRSLLCEYCSLLRRLSLSDEVIKVLNPIIHPKVRRTDIASELEKVEYAGALVRLGLISEALEILKKIDSKKVPRALMIQGFAHIGLSDYKNSNRAFENYLDLEKRQTLYDDFIAKVNLLQGHIFLKNHQDASSLIQELKNELDPKAYKLLYIALYEFESELFRQKSQFKKAIKTVSQGIKLLGDIDTIDTLLIYKQKAIILAFESGDISELLKVKEKAKQKNHIDTIRETELFISLINQDKNLAKKLYWGTPYPHYKKRINSYLGQLLTKEELSEYRFQKRKGEIIEIENVKGLKKNQIPHRLFKILLGDFYEGQTKKRIFNALFPTEYYSPTHSGNRVQQALQRLKSLIAQNDLPFSLNEYKGRFSLSPTRAVTLTTNFSQTSDLYTYFKNNWFTIKDVEKEFNISWRTAHRRVKNLCNNSFLESKGRTASKKYRFKK